MFFFVVALNLNLKKKTIERCCKCGAKGVKRALKAAPRFEEVHGDAEMMPSFMEMVATFQHAAQNGVEECCPCKHHKKH
jgi:hypothetical protein